MTKKESNPAEEAYIADTQSMLKELGPEAVFVDELMQEGIGELIAKAAAAVPVMTDAVGVAVVRALLLNAALCAIRTKMPEDSFMRVARKGFNLARMTTREVDAAAKR